MRIIQIIDSLEVGGAEKMAVNYANSLAQVLSFSGLVTTRKEGKLKSEIDAKVSYLFLNKKREIDIAAVLRLRNYCKTNKANIIHAHGTSFFIAFLLKMTLPNIKIIWHDHNGDRINQTRKKNKVLWFCSKFFSGIIVVNQRIALWVRQNLGIKKVLNLPNFTLAVNSDAAVTALKGNSGKRILYLANLRYPKNHLLVVSAAIRLKSSHPDWSFHFVGNDLEDQYSKEIKKAVTDNDLDQTVYIYGLKTDSANIIKQSDIALIASSYEGLPVALLEYGQHKKAVVVTAVGEIPHMIQNGINGLIVSSGDVDAFTKSLVRLIEDENMRADFGNALYETIIANHSEKAVIGQYLKWLATI